MHSESRVMHEPRLVSARDVCVRVCREREREFLCV